MPTKGSILALAVSVLPATIAIEAGNLTDINPPSLLIVAKEMALHCDRAFQSLNLSK